MKIIVSTSSRYLVVAELSINKLIEFGISRDDIVICGAKVESNKLVATPDRGMIGNLLDVIDNIDDDYIFLMQDDHYFLKIDPEQLFGAFQAAKEWRLDYIRVVRQTGDPDTDLDSANLLMKKYAVSFQPAIWRVKYLEKFLKQGTNPWLLERNFRHDSEDKCHVVSKNSAWRAMVVEGTLIRKGRLTRAARTFLKKEDFSRINFFFPVENIYATFWSRFVSPILRVMKL